MYSESRWDFCSVSDIECMALYELSKYAMTKLYPQPSFDQETGSKEDVESWLGTL